MEGLEYFFSVWRGLGTGVSEFFFYYESKFLNQSAGGLGIRWWEGYLKMS